MQYNRDMSLIWIMLTQHIQVSVQFRSLDCSSCNTAVQYSITLLAPLKNSRWMMTATTLNFTRLEGRGLVKEAGSWSAAGTWITVRALERNFSQSECPAPCAWRGSARHQDMTLEWNTKLSEQRLDLEDFCSGISHAPVLYSASVLDLATGFCFLEHQKMILGPK